VLDLIAFAEIALVVGAAALAKLLYLALLRDTAHPMEPYVLAGLTGGFLIHYMMRLRGLTDAAAIRDWKRRSGELVAVIAISFLMLIAVAFLLKVSADYSRGWVLLCAGLVAVLLPASRPLSARLLDWLAAGGYTARRIAIVATPEAGRALAESFVGTPGIRIVGVFDDAPRAWQNARLASISELISVGQRNQIDEIVVALNNGPETRMRSLLDRLSVLPVDVWLCPAGIDVPILRTARLGALSLLQVKPQPIRDWGFLLKVAVDYVAGALALVVFAPLMAMIAVAIKLDSRGPVLFRQRRHGYNHRIIDVYKFRTMTVAEDGERIEQASVDDPRITRIGRYLRRASLDELPQLFNVMKGEMSLVGPRPHALAHNHHYRERLARYANRHCVRPGITGLAQIGGFRGPTDDPEKMRRRVELDLYYIENWSPLLDLKILALTPFVGFVHRNAL
jgi:putative colanic acid biosynthesis UDP-glucose lipid carrier transferase